MITGGNTEKNLIVIIQDNNFYCQKVKRCYNTNMADRCNSFHCEFYRNNGKAGKGHYCVWQKMEDSYNGKVHECKPEECRLLKENPCNICKRNSCARRAALTDAQAKILAAVEEELPFQSQAEKEAKKEAQLTRAIAYVDGSYNDGTSTYGYGVVLMDESNTKLWEFFGSGNDKSVSKMHNVAGEILGSCKAMTEACRHGFKELEIRFDYEGVEKWVTGAWKAKNEYTTKYRDFALRHQNQGLQLTFTKIKAHTSEIGNERADELAKQAAGVTLSCM